LAELKTKEWNVVMTSSQSQPFPLSQLSNSFLPKTLKREDLLLLHKEKMPRPHGHMAWAFFGQIDGKCPELHQETPQPPLFHVLVVAAHIIIIKKVSLIYYFACFLVILGDF
jgi:hypothetical protein